MKRSNFLATIAAIFLAPFGIKAKPKDTRVWQALVFDKEQLKGRLEFAVSKDACVWKKVSPTEWEIDASGWEKTVISNNRIVFTHPKAKYISLSEALKQPPMKPSPGCEFL